MAGWLLLALVLLNFETESSDGFGKLKGKHHRFVVCPFRDRRSHDKVARSDGFSPGQAMEQNLSNLVLLGWGWGMFCLQGEFCCGTGRLWHQAGVERAARENLLEHCGKDFGFCSWLPKSVPAFLSAYRYGGTLLCGCVLLEPAFNSFQSHLSTRVRQLNV